MGVPADEQRALVLALGRMGLLERDETPEFAELTGGVSSRIVRARTARGQVCVKRALPRLKVEKEWTAPVERNGAEVGWLRIASEVVPGLVPPVLGEDPESGSFAMAYLDPSAFPVWKSLLRDGTILPATAAAIGRAIVAIHASTAGSPKVASAFANDSTFDALRLNPYLMTTAAVHPDCAAALIGLSATTASTRRALVHGDVSPKNILVGGGGPIILDAECAWYGDPAFDLAFCLNHMLLKCVWRPHWTRRYLDCFDALTDAYLEGVRWEDPAGLESRAARLLPGLMLARIDGKSPVEYITLEPDRDRVRRFSRERLFNPGATLRQIRSEWEIERES